MSTIGISATALDAPTCMHCNGALDPALTPLTETTCPSCGQVTMVPGRLGQQYRLIRLIGAGGMGAVYEGFDDGLCRKIAVKVILREKAEEDPTFIESFRREAQSAARLNSPNIVAIYAFGEAEGQPYLVMELVQADALDKMMASGPLMPATALNICMQIAQGLRAASEQGLVHGDVKPENILINEAREAKLADFGIAALAGASAAANNEVWGTPYYIAPETLRKQKVDLRADIYSLGGTLYHAIAGVPPFEGADAIEVMKARLTGPARPLTDYRPDCPEGIAKIVMRMLEPELIRRYPNYDALLNDMRKELRSAHATIGGGKRITIKGKNVTGPISLPSKPMAAVPNVNAPLIERKRRTGLWIGLGVGGGILALIGGLLAIFLGGDEPQTTTSSTTASADASQEAPTALALAIQAATNTLTDLQKEVDATQRDIETAVRTIDNALKSLVAEARKVLWEEDEAWLTLQSTDEQAPTILLQNVQAAYQAQAIVTPLREGIDKERKRLSEALAQLPTESEAALTAHVEATTTAWQSFKNAEAFKAYPKLVREIQAMTAPRTLKGTIDKALDYRNKLQEEKEKQVLAAKAAEEAERKRVEAEKQAVEEIEMVQSDLAKYVDKKLKEFEPQAAREEYTKRIDRSRRLKGIKTPQGKAAQQAILNRIDAMDAFKTWLLQLAKQGLRLTDKSGRRLELSEVTETTLNVGGKTRTWPKFLMSRDVMTLYTCVLIDESSSRRFGLAPSKRAEMSAFALYMMDLFIEVSARDNKVFQEAQQALRDIVQTSQKAQSLLEDLTLSTMEEDAAEATSGEEE